MPYGQVDPSVIMAAGQPTVPRMNPMDVQQQALSLQQLQQNVKLRNQELQQGAMALRDQQELAQAYANKDNIDPDTGMLKPSAIQGINNPQLKQKLVQGYNEQQYKVAQNKLTHSKEAMELNKLRMETEKEMREKAQAAYDSVLENTKDEKAATAAFNDAQKDGIGELRKTGIYPSDYQFKMMTPKENAMGLQTYQQRMESQDKAKAAATDPFMKEAEQLYGKGTPQYNAALKAHISKMDAPSVTQIKLGEEAKAAEAAKKPLDQTAQDALDIQSWNYIKDGKLPYRKGSGGGADRNDAVIRNVAKIAENLGMTPQELVAQSAEFKANASSLALQTKKMDAIETALSSFHNNLDTWDSLAKGVVPQVGGPHMKELAKDLQKIDFTGVRGIDDVKMRIEQQLNDPTTSAVAVAAMAAAMDYGRIMQGPQSNAALTEGARTEAMRLISASADAKGREGIIAALESDTEGQVKGLRDQTEKIKSRLSGRTISAGDKKEAKSMSDQDKAALDWANKNKDDPRAKKILEHLGG